MLTFCSSLTKFSSTKSVQTKFVAPQKLLIDTFLVIKVIISCNNFIAIDPIKRFGRRFSFSDFHGQKLSWQQEPGLRAKITENMIKYLNIQLTGIFSNTYHTQLAFQTPQMISSCVPIVEIKIVFLKETTCSKIVMLISLKTSLPLIKTQQNSCRQFLLTTFNQKILEVDEVITKCFYASSFRVFMPAK